MSGTSKNCRDCGHGMEACVCMLLKCFLKINRPRGCCQDYIQASSPSGQIIQTSNVGEKIDIATTDANRGIENENAGEFVVRRAGTYGVIAAPQAGRQDQQSGSANFRCWLAVNGGFVPNSNVLLNLLPSDDGGIKDVIVSQGFLELEAGDRLTVLMATNNAPAQVGTEAIQPSSIEPLVPGIIFSMWELCCDDASGHGGQGGC